MIYKKNDEGVFELEKVREFAFSHACMNFHFNKDNTNELFFFTYRQCFKYDYMDENKERETFHKFGNELGTQPKFASFSKD